MKKLYYITFTIAGLALLFIFLPWIHRSNSDYYVYGISFNTGKLGLVAIVFSSILLILKKIKIALVIAFISFVSSLSFVIGWSQKMFSNGHDNIFEGLQINLFLHLFFLLIFIIMTAKIKRSISESNKK
jgi:hypothetical protein